MPYNLEKLGFKIFRGLKIGDTITTDDLHRRILEKTGFTKQLTRAKLLRTFESMRLIELKEIGLWKIIKIPEPDKYDPSWLR